MIGVWLTGVARVLGVVLATFYLAGCCQGNSAAITPVDPLILTAIVLYFRRTQKWNFGTGEEDEEPDEDVRNKIDEARQLDRHRGFFVRRRAQFIGERNPDLVAEVRDTPNWENSPVKPRLVRRVESELDAAESYFADKIGTTGNPGPLGGGPGDPPFPGDPAHLDLEDVARVHTNTSERSARRKARTYLRLRRQRVGAIVWRGAALDDDVWEAAPDRTSAVLRRALGPRDVLVLEEVLDRRLHMVERMTTMVSSYRALGGRRWRLPISGMAGPWRDRFRVRAFEYPRLLKETERFEHFIPAIGAENIAPADKDFREFPPGSGRIPPWRYGVNDQRLEYNVPPSPGAHFPQRLEDDFHLVSDYTYGMMKRSGRTAAQVVDDMFLVGLPDSDRENFWERVWVLCDHCMSALFIEGLRFGLRRRTGSDDEFNRIHSDHPEGYMALSAFTGGARGGHLMSDPDDPYFANLTNVQPADLQVGDHTVFWNSYLYSELTIGVWRLEHSLIVDVDSDPLTGGVLLPRLRLQGHGIKEHGYRGFQRELADQVERGLREAHRLAEAIGTDPARDRIDYAEREGRFFRWSPYEDFGEPGAWWLRIPATSENLARFLPVRQIVRHLPEDQRGTGYRPPPTEFIDNLFFPLYEPRIRGGWHGYLLRRRTEPSFPPPRLRKVQVDEDSVPGLFKRGSEGKIDFIRPKARR